MMPNRDRPNYVTEYRSFLREARRTGLGATPQLMYLHMLDIANDAEWPETLHISNVELGQRLGCSDESILRARRVLSKMGRIEYLGQRKQRPLYRICYYTQAVEKTVENPGDKEEEDPPGPPVEKAVERPVEQGVERIVEQRVEHIGNPMENQGIHPVVEPVVERAVEQGVEDPVERAVESPVETSQRETPNETPGFSSSSSSSAREGEQRRERLRTQLALQLHPPGPAEEALIAVWAEAFDPEVVEDMLRLALKREARSYRYLEVGLQRLRARGITTLAAYRAQEAAFAAARERSGPAPQYAAKLRPVREVAQHRYAAQRDYPQDHWDALLTDPFSVGSGK